MPLRAFFNFAYTTPPYSGDLYFGDLNGAFIGSYGHGVGEGFGSTAGEALTYIDDPPIESRGEAGPGTGNGSGLISTGRSCREYKTPKKDPEL